MDNERIVKSIKKRLRKGENINSIIESLIKDGMSEKDVFKIMDLLIEKETAPKHSIFSDPRLEIIAVILIIGLIISCAWFIGFVKFGRESNFNQTFNNSYDALMVGPQMRTISKMEPIFHESGDYMFTPRAYYQGTMKVMEKKYYNDNMVMSPVDLLMSWGDVANPKKCPTLKTTMGVRFGFGMFTKCEFNSQYMGSHMGNNHIIPANKIVKKGVNKLIPGDIAYFEGYLVDVKDLKDSSRSIWSTSLTRTDMGQGACEIFYLKKLVLNNETFS